MSVITYVCIEHPWRGRKDGAQECRPCLPPALSLPHTSKHALRSAHSSKFKAKGFFQILVVLRMAFLSSVACRDELTWNIRDQAMVRTIAHLDQHLQRLGPWQARIVVWAHNSHLGDAVSPAFHVEFYSLFKFHSFICST